MLTRLFARHPPAPATRPNAAVDWPFPFPAAGRTRPAAPDTVPAGIAYRWPYRRLDTPPLPNRGVPAPVSIAAFKQQVTEWCDDVGVISIDHPAIAHEREEVLYVYPHARSPVCMIGEENKAALQSRYLPSANGELYRCEERLWEMGRLFLAIHRGDRSAVWGLVTGRIRLAGRRRLFRHFPRLFPTDAPSTPLARWLFLARRRWRRRGRRRRSSVRR